MAWVPIIVSNRRANYRRSKSGKLCAVIIFSLVLFGMLFLVLFGFFDIYRFGFPPIFLFSGIGVFILLVICISAVSMSISETNKTPKREDLRRYQYLSSEHSQQINPYKIRGSIQKQSNELIDEEITQEIPTISVINYCRYCGAKVDRDAIFCHLCGSKL